MPSGRVNVRATFCLPVYASQVRAARTPWSATRLAALGATAAIVLAATKTRAADAAPAADPPARTDAEGAQLARDIETAPPPPSHVVYFQYGVAFTTEQIVAPGPICNNAGVPCILGPGGGIVVRAGYRSIGSLYLGGAYELTKQDPNKLYRIALLQQARAEGRYYFVTARVTEPYVSAALGVSGYGNEWKIDTWGPAGAIGVGIEHQITRRTVVGVALNYRLLYFNRFVDTANSHRDPGVAQLFGLDLVLEQRDPAFRDGAESAR